MPARGRSDGRRANPPIALPSERLVAAITTSSARRLLGNCSAISATTLAVATPKARPETKRHATSCDTVAEVAVSATHIPSSSTEMTIAHLRLKRSPTGAMKPLPITAPMLSATIAVPSLVALIPIRARARAPARLIALMS